MSASSRSATGRGARTGHICIIVCSLVDNHKIMLGPRAMGTITHLAEKGSYTVDDVVCEIEFQGKTTKHTITTNDMVADLVVRRVEVPLEVSVQSLGIDSTCRRVSFQRERETRGTYEECKYSATFPEWP
jgi:hypothetical protein